MPRSVTESEYAQGIAHFQEIITAFGPNTDSHPEPFEEMGFVDKEWMRRVKAFFAGLPQTSRLCLLGREWSSARERYECMIDVCNVSLQFYAPGGGETQFVPSTFHPKRGCRDVDLQRLARLREAVPAYLAQVDS